MSREIPRKNGPWALVVDDDIDSRMSTILCLQHHGVATVGCANGVEAIKVMVRAIKGLNLPDMIFLDLNMPVFTGWEFLELLDVTRDEIRDVPVIVMTGEHIPNVSIENHRVLRKPFDLDQLLAEADRALALRNKKRRQ